MGRFWEETRYWENWERDSRSSEVDSRILPEIADVRVLPPRGVLMDTALLLFKFGLSVTNFSKILLAFGGIRQTWDVPCHQVNINGNTYPWLRSND